MAPVRSWGLPWHLCYPFISLTLVAIPAFVSSKSLWWVSANTANFQIRFGAQDWCGFNRSAGNGNAIYHPVGCIYGGTSYTVAVETLGQVNLPESVSYSLSRSAALVYLCFALLLVAGVHQLYATRYSYGEDPNKDKNSTLISVHYFLSLGTSLILIVTLFVLLIVCGVSVNNRDVQREGTVIWWGQLPWLVLTATLLSGPWAYEAIRWRRVSKAQD